MLGLLSWSWVVWFRGTVAFISELLAFTTLSFACDRNAETLLFSSISFLKGLSWASRLRLTSPMWRLRQTSPKSSRASGAENAESRARRSRPLVPTPANPRNP